MKSGPIRGSGPDTQDRPGLGSIQLHVIEGLNHAPNPLQVPGEYGLGIKAIGRRLAFAHLKQFKERTGIKLNLDGQLLNDFTLGLGWLLAAGKEGVPKQRSKIGD